MARSRSARHRRAAATQSATEKGSPGSGIPRRWQGTPRSPPAVGWLVPTRSPRRTWRESALSSSARPSRRASPSASAVLPVAVGPTRAMVGKDGWLIAAPSLPSARWALGYRGLGGAAPPAVPARRVGDRGGGGATGPRSAGGSAEGTAEAGIVEHQDGGPAVRAGQPPGGARQPLQQLRLLPGTEPVAQPDGGVTGGQRRQP